jgi:hypothetical protein
VQPYSAPVEPPTLKPPTLEPPTLEPPPATVPSSGARWWWLIVGLVTLAALVVGSVALGVQLQPSAPSSADELRSLLITPPGNTSEITGATPLIKTAGPGVRWSVTRAWVDAGKLNAGSVTLIQYESEDQAQAALARFSDQTGGTHQQVDGHPGAFFVPGRSVKLLGRSVQSGTGAGATHTVVVYLAGTSDATDGLPHLLAEQLDRLP